MHSIEFREKLLAGLFTTRVLSRAAVRCSVLEEEPKSASDESPKTTKISGVLEAVVAHEISVGTEQIDSLKIKRILPHGTKVSKGQNIVWFETEEIDKKIKEAEIDLRLSKLTLEDDEFQLQTVSGNTSD